MARETQTDGHVDEPVSANVSVPVATQSAWRRWRWPLAGALVLVVLASVAYIARARSAFAQQIAALRARGEPTSLTELADYYPAPPAETDATALWLNAATALERRSYASYFGNLTFFGGGDPPPPGSPWPGLPLARKVMQGAAEQMQQLHQAAALGGRARYTTDFFGPLDHLSALRSAVRFLALQALARKYDGDLAGAAESINTALVLSQSLAEEPIFVSQMARIGMHQTMVRLLKQIETKRLPAESLAQLQLTLSRIEFSNAMLRAAIGSRAYGLALFDDPNRYFGLGQAGYLAWLPRQGDALTYLGIMDEYIAALSLPWAESAAPLDAWAGSLDARTSKLNIFTRMLTPGLDTVAVAFRQAETLNRLTIVHVAIARFWQRHARPPQTLDELAPEFLPVLPVAPMTNAPFSYRATAEGYVLFCPADPQVSKSNLVPDAETGADPLLLFRWPPLPEEPKDALTEPPAETSEDKQDAAGDETGDNSGGEVQ